MEGCLKICMLCNACGKAAQTQLVMAQHTHLLLMILVNGYKSFTVRIAVELLIVKGHRV